MGDKIIMSLPTLGPTDLELFYVGAQFFASSETSKPAIGAKVASSTAKICKHAVTPPRDTVLESYLQTVNRSELLSLGMQSSHSSQYFDNRLRLLIDELLLYIRDIAHGGSPVDEEHQMHAA